jgi:2-isopropylmalate synthase
MHTQSQQLEAFNMPKWANTQYRPAIFWPAYYLQARFKQFYQIHLSQEDVSVAVFDTTMRDGDQTPNRAMTIKQKVICTDMLCQLGVQVIETGFPASAGDHTTAITESGMRHTYPATQVCGLTRTVVSDVHSAHTALSDVNPGCAMIHTFAATSPDHRMLKLSDKSIAQVCEMVCDAVTEICRPRDTKGKSKFIAMFSPEDATNTPITDLYKVVEAAVQSGATIINIPDTLGVAQSDEITSLISKMVTFCNYLRLKYAISDEVIVSFHGHDDSNLSTANTLAAIEAGAKMIQTTLNGVGERMGNASLVRILMAMLARPDRYSRFDTGLDISKMTITLMKYDEMMGTHFFEDFSRQFFHSSGVHQSQVAKGVIQFLQQNPDTVMSDGVFYDQVGNIVPIKDVYQVLDAETFGYTVPYYGLVLTKHSGVAALKAVLAMCGYDISTVDDIAMAEAFRIQAVDAIENDGQRIFTVQMVEKMAMTLNIS